jgi:hypothetical protein
MTCEGSIVVYTAIFGSYDQLVQPAVVDPAVRYVCFTDRPIARPGAWNVRLVDADEATPTRCNRKYKLLAHRWFPDAAWTIYLDGNGRLMQHPAEVIEQAHAAGGSFLTVTWHWDRRCVYAEGREVIRLRRDSKAIVTDQLDRYRREGLPPRAGLYACGLLIRRRCPEAEQVNEAWWAQVQRGSQRDQLSLPYILWKLRHTPNCINRAALCRIAQLPAPHRPSPKETPTVYHRRHIINMAVAAGGARSYLEIGIMNPDNTFKHVWCTDKVGVDPAVRTQPDVRPMTSDDYFQKCGRTFDVIFIDGDHRLEAVRRDVPNAFDHLNRGGVVLMHDVNPVTPQQALPEPIRPGASWCGEAWRVFLHYRCLTDYDAITIPDDCGGGVGVGVIVRGPNRDRLDLDPAPETIDALTYDDLARNRSRWMRLVSPYEAASAIHKLIHHSRNHHPTTPAACG